MRDYLVVAIVLLSMPVGLIQPYYGSLVYAWISYMYPHYLAWTFARTFPVAKVAALSVIAGVLFRQAWNFKPLRQRETILMLLLLGWFGISSLFAFNPAAAWTKWLDMAKIIIMAAVTATLVTDRGRLKNLFLVIAISIGFHGLKGGLFSLRTGGQYMVMGPGESILGANNNFGLALTMALPFFWYLSNDCKSKASRFLLRTTFFLSIPAVMFTYSRASLLGLAVVLLAMIAKSRRVVILLVSIILLGILIYPLIPDRWITRQETIATYEQDSSAMSRIDNWKFCWKLALDRPIVGGGFDYNSPAAFLRYAPEFLNKYGGRTWDSHSIYFGILAAHGFPGLLLFMGMIGSAYLSCRKLRRKSASIPGTEWIANYSHMIELSFLALLVNGAFVNMEYFDLPYHLAGAVACLKIFAAQGLAQLEAGSQANLNPAAEPALAIV